MLNALDLAADWAMKALGDMTGRPAAEVAQGFIDLWRRILSGSHFGSGCAIAAVTVAAETPELLNRAATIFRNWVSQIGALLAEGGVPKDRAPALATMLISACEGAVILSRAEQSFGPLDLVAAELIAAIAAAQGEKTEG